MGGVRNVGSSQGAVKSRSMRSARDVGGSQGAGKSRSTRSARGNRNTRYAGSVRDVGNSRNARYSRGKNQTSGSNYRNYANNDRKCANSRANRSSDYREKQSSPLSKISERIGQAKHDAKKSRAGKMFERQFEDAPSTASTNAPRAALYKAEMGKTQRYSQKLQREGNAGVRRGGGVSTKGQAGGRANSQANIVTRGESRTHANAHSTNGSSFWDKTPHVANMRKKHPILTASVALFLVLVMGVGYMFPTAQTYYKTMRENERIQAEYEAVLARNDDLQRSIDSLSTSDGIENLAHAEYNLTKQGETSVSVQGIEDNSNILDKVNASVKSENVAFPATWYSGVLDQIFGVK